ncbi:MAG: hypothetical protein D6705_00385 [Deltaproteobacteria bacterium]|nr:MAG: hypothetical protein D6705_00385 [Deltaproteobacteria bacterium]
MPVVLSATLTVLLAWTFLAGSERATPPDGPSDEEAVGRPRRAAWRAYLGRPVLEGPHVLGHGVVEVTASGGFPHLYQFGVGVGLFDHLTLRVRGHYLPGERYGRLAPDVALAFFRGRYVALGARYHFQVERPPPLDGDPDTPSFEQRIHVLTATFVAGTRFVAAGVEVGWARGRIPDPRSPTPEALVQTPVTVDRLAGGLSLRLGTPRFGVFARALWPFLIVDVGLDVRFGAFEVPPRTRRTPPEDPLLVRRRWSRR